MPSRNFLTTAELAAMDAVKAVDSVMRVEGEEGE